MICFSQKCYERILTFLYPTYSIMEHPMVCSGFITRRDIVDRSEREALDYEYSDCVFISRRLFDELWTEDIIIREVLSFARDRMGSRRRVFRPTCTEGDAFIDECIQFMFMGSVGSGDEDSSMLTLFDAYGSSQFVKDYVSLCGSRGVPYVFKSMSTFLLRVLQGSDSLYYKKAGLRLRGSLLPNLQWGVACKSLLDSYFTRYFPDLTTVWCFMNLCKRNYFGRG